MYGGGGYRRNVREGRGDLVQLPALPQDSLHGAGADQDRCGLTALFWLNVNPYGTLQLDLVPMAVPRAPIRRPSPLAGAVGSLFYVNDRANN